MFQCDINDAPVIGILGIVSNRAIELPSMWKPFVENVFSAGMDM